VAFFKAEQKPFWWSIRGNYFMCVLLKAPVENCNADVPEAERDGPGLHRREGERKEPGLAEWV